MDIEFKWAQHLLTDDQRASMEKRFCDDLKTLIGNETGKISVVIDDKIPGIGISGFIADTKGVRLYTFKCQPQNNFTTEYVKL